jgi:hypothetical protein
MSTTILSATTVALLTAACPTAFADSNDAADSTSGYIQAVGRNGSHSMHPNAPVTAEQFAGDDVEVLQQTADE